MIISRRGLWVLYSKRLRLSQNRSFCSSSKIEKPNINAGNDNSKNGSKEVVNADESSSSDRIDAYKELPNLNFMSAAKILFSDPPKKKKFGYILFLTIECLLLLS